MKRTGLLVCAVAVLLFGLTHLCAAQGGTAAQEDAGGQPSTIANNEAEQQALDVLREMESQRQGMLNVSHQDGRLLRLLTETIGAKHVVEIGTSNGYSGIWLCIALRNTGGKLTTHDIDPAKVILATENFKRAGVGDIATVVEGDAHETVKRIKEPIDMLFLDADKPGYVDYLDKLLPLIRPGGLIVAHNMRRPGPDPKYLEAITTNSVFETTFLLMEGSGLGVTLKKRQ